MQAKRLDGETKRPLTMRGARAALALTLLIAVFGAEPVASQMASPTPESYLRVEWTVEQSKSGRQRIAGYAYNSRDVWAAGVRLLVEVLDASGQVVGSTLASVYGEVPPRNRSYFEVPVPAAGARYRVTVRSVEWRGYGGGGG